MKTAIAAIVLFVGTSVVYAQVGQDLKAAGQNTKDAAVTGAKKTGNGTKKAYKSSTHAVKKGTNKAANTTAKGAKKVADKTTPKS
jgi:outer membrane lipoprotein-sorting protein